MHSTTVRKTYGSRSREAGSVLVTSIVLLLLAGVMTLFALNVGVFEQRTTSNDLRAKLTHEVAEAGLAQAFEFLMRQDDIWIKDANRWESCLNSDITFPCGAIEPPRRSTMYRLRATGNVITGLEALSPYMLPLNASLATVGNGDPVSYGVAPLLCRAERPLPSDPPDAPVRCGTGTGAGATDLHIVTFVSVANMVNETARTTLVQTLGQYPLLGDLIGKPPLTTSGSADVTGGLQIVTNPNAGGSGVPVSVWTRRDVEKTGTPNTCYADEFFRYAFQAGGLPAAKRPKLEPASCGGQAGCKQTIRCDECSCDFKGAPNTLSFDNSGNVQAEGIDILDVEGGSLVKHGEGVHKGTNSNVRSDADSYPECEFPPDMFKYVFGVATWSDVDKDCFGEVKVPAQYLNPNSGQLVGMGADEAWLFENAKKVIPAPPDEAPAIHTYSGVKSRDMLKEGQSANSDYLDDKASGIIWCQAGCNIGASQEVGSALNPVILIVDGPVDIKGVVWGFVFVREARPGNLQPTTGNVLTTACQPNCMMTMNAGAAVYGAMVVQGQIKANGGGAIIYDATVLANLEAQGGTKYATLPGAWTDRRSY
jgi:hypothetical protein